MSADPLADLLAKSVGESDVEQEVKGWLCSGFPELNKALSGRYDGGFGFGRMYEIYGPSSSGKSALATAVMTNAQKLGGFAIFIDYERTFDVGMAIRGGLETPGGKWLYRRPETWEDGNAIALKAADTIRKSKLLSDDAPICIVQDSIASAIPKSQLYDAKGNRREIDSMTMNDTTALSRVTSTTLKMVASYSAELNATVIYLNQIRTKPGVTHGDPTTTPGGSSMEFYASGRIALGRVREMEDKELVGQIVRCKVVKSKHTRPFSVADLNITFEDDGCAVFDRHVSLMNHLLEIEAIEKAGSRIKWEGGTPFKSQVIEKLKADPDGYEKLKALLPK